MSPGVRGRRLSRIRLGTGDLATVTSTIPDATSLQGVVDYSYDAKRQLTKEVSDRVSGYSYANAFDGAGNATTFRNDPHSYNDDNQLTGPATYVYDGNGNPTTFGGTSLSFDVENRMTGYGTALTAGYRGDGLRAWKQPGGGNKTYFLYDRISVLCELDHTGAVSASSTYGAKGLLSRGSVQYQCDPLGDAVLLLDGSGDVTATQGFDAWGNALVTATGPFGYRARYGYYADSETELVALAYRYYGPGVGRFVNRDPAGFESGIGLYLYTAGGPVSALDPSGLGSDSLVVIPGKDQKCVDAATLAYAACLKSVDEELIATALACFAGCGYFIKKGGLAAYYQCVMWCIVGAEAEAIWKTWFCRDDYLDALDRCPACYCESCVNGTTVPRP